MLLRAKFPKQRDVLLINDVPVKGELAPRTKEDEYGDKFSAISNLGFLTSLRKGTLDIYTSDPSKADLPGIKNKDIATTYLDYTYYGEPELEKNFDYFKELTKRKFLKDIGEGFLGREEEVDGTIVTTRFYKVEQVNDLYMSERLGKELQALLAEIRLVQPKLIIVTGKWTLFFLTFCSTFGSNVSTASVPKPFGAVAKFRSSILQIHSSYEDIPEHVLIPIYHPVNAISMPDKSYIMDLDIQKICWMHKVIQEQGVGYYIRPDKEYIIGNTFEKAIGYLDELLAVLAERPTRVSIDIETFFRSTIDCVGFAYQTNRGCCIPFASKDSSSLWSIEEEVEIMIRIREILIHKNCLHVGQNYAFDCQYFYKLWCLPISPNNDTMILHHKLFNKLAKDLAFMASLYCETYTYWKDEIEGLKETPETRWVYNAKDCCYTLEILEVLLGILEESEDEAMQALYRFEIEELHPELIKTMNRGVRVNTSMKESLYSFFRDMLDKVPGEINKLLGFEYNNNSVPQKKKLFKEFLGIELKTVKKKGKAAPSETCDAKAMLEYIENYPLLRPFLMVLLEYSALGKFTNTFLGMKLDRDGRMRTQYKLTGTALGRLSSNKNVWGNGGNLQNLSEKGKVPVYTLLELLRVDTITEVDTSEALEYIEALEGEDYAEY